MKKRLGKILAVAAAACAALAAISISPRPIAANTLSTAILGMFPREVGEFAYADLKAARKYPWFQQLRDQMMPARFRQFEQFLSSAGLDPTTQVDEIAWAAVPPSKDHSEQILGVALGQFSPQAAEEKFKQQKLPKIQVRGYNLYAFGSGFGPNDILFFFLDSNTAAFGHRAALEKLIGVRFGDSESLLNNEKLFPLINETNGNGLVWAVLNEYYTRLGMQQLLPQAGQFPQAAEIVARIHAMTINVQADDGVDARFQAVCASPEDANLLAAALQAGVMMRRYQEAQANHTDLANALDALRVSPDGDRLRVEIPLSQDQLNTLLRERAFAVPM